MGMLSEKLMKFKGLLRVSTGVTYEEKSPSLTGELFFKLYDGDKIVEEYRHSNIIVNTASILIARLLKDNDEPTNGISYLAAGSGNAGWDAFDPPAPTTSQTRLENEFARKSITLKTFVDPETGEPTETQTNIVDYSVTFGEGEAVGPIMELALFGGDATAEFNSGTMINWRTFPVINKTNTMTLTVIFRITS